MTYEELEQCCNQKPIAIVEYELDSLGTKKFKVCKNHIRKSPWNKHIVSQVKFGDSLD